MTPAPAPVAVPEGREKEMRSLLAMCDAGYNVAPGLIVEAAADLLRLLDAERERVRELEAEASNLRAIIAEAIDSKRGYCPGPNGHSQDYVMKSSVQKMRRALAAHRKRALVAGKGGR